MLKKTKETKAKTKAIVPISVEEIEKKVEGYLAAIDNSQRYIEALRKKIGDLDLYRQEATSALHIQAITMVMDVLKRIRPEEITDAREFKTLVESLKILTELYRLEHDKGTSNTSIMHIHATLEQLQDKRKLLEKEIEGVMNLAPEI